VDRPVVDDLDRLADVNPGVTPAHQRIAESDVAVGPSADPYRAVVQLDDPRGVGTGEDRERGDRLGTDDLAVGELYGDTGPQAGLRDRRARRHVPRGGRVGADHQPGRLAPGRAGVPGPLPDQLGQLADRGAVTEADVDVDV